MELDHLVDHEDQSFAIDPELHAKDWSLGGVVVHMGTQMGLRVEGQNLQGSL